MQQSVQPVRESSRPSMGVATPVASSSLLRRVPRVRAADLLTGWFGVAYLIPLELLAIGWHGFELLWVSVAMLLGLGLAVGLVIALGESLARSLASSWARALVRSLASLIVTVPVGEHLFDGGFAATLPGASSAFAWFPALGVVALTVALRVGERLSASTRGRVALGISLIVGALAMDWVNRNVKRTEYDDVHTMLLCMECIAFGLGVRLLPWDVAPSARRRWQVVGACGLVSVLLLAAALSVGLQGSDARKALASEGMHARLLVRVVRSLFDGDGDGHSTVLGGGDCDDDDATIRPGALELEGNAIDEDCDGSTELDPAVIAARKAAAAHGDALRAFEQSQGVADFVARTRRYNVLLIAVDTLRADVLLAEDARTAFPRFHELLGASRWFRHAFAPAAGTDLSMGGLLTGRIDPYTPGVKTVAMAARESGRVTHGVIPREVLRYVGKELLTRGLDGRDRLLNDLHDRDVGSYTTSARTSELGLQFLDGWQAQSSDAPFWLWLHYFDVHEHHEVKLSDKHLRERLEDRGDKLTKMERYRLLVSVVDEQIGVVMDALRERGLWDSTIIVLVSDHGEGLGEDSRLPENHGRVVYNPLVHVPLAIRIPGVAPRAIETPVSLLDVYPTLLQLMGTPVPKNDGISLLPHLVEGAPDELDERVRPLPLNESDQYGVVAWPHKLVVHRQSNAEELYDLARDPEEKVDLSGREPALVRRLRSAYGAFAKVEIDRTEKGRRAREARAMLRE